MIERKKVSQENVERILAWISERGQIQRERKDFQFSSEGCADASLLILPDIIERKRLGEIIELFEDRGFEIKAMSLVRMTPEQVRRMYPRYNDRILSRIIPRIANRDSVYVRIFGYNPGNFCEKAKGYFLPSFASPSSIRGRYSSSVKEGVSLHTFDTEEEIAWFEKEFL